MPNVRTQCREAYTPRAISKGILKALVEALVDFKPGLPTTSRKIKARAISAGKSTELEGPECWKVTDPHSLAELENVRVELLLASTDHRKCELHVEFRSGQILLSVSDIETSWGKSVFEDTRVLLSELGISSKGFNERLRNANGLLDIFQNVLLALAVAVFAVWLTGRRTIYLYASLAFVRCRRHAGVDPLVPFLFASQEDPDFPGNGRQGQKFSMGGSDGGPCFLHGLASAGESTGCHFVVKRQNQEKSHGA